MPLLVQSDFEEHLSVGLELKEIILVLPHGYVRNKDLNIEELKERLTEDREEWMQEQEDEEGATTANQRRVLPIIHSYYFLYVRPLANAQAKRLSLNSPKSCWISRETSIHHGI